MRISGDGTKSAHIAAYYHAKGTTLELPSGLTLACLPATQCSKPGLPTTDGYPAV